MDDNEVTEAPEVVVNVETTEPDSEPDTEPVVVVVEDAGSDNTPTLVALAVTVGAHDTAIADLQRWRETQEQDTALAVGLAESAIEATEAVAEVAVEVAVEAEVVAAEVNEVAEEVDSIVPDESRKHWFFETRSDRKAWKAN